jgi:hypothetical protein
MDQMEEQLPVFGLDLRELDGNSAVGNMIDDLGLGVQDWEVLGRTKVKGEFRPYGRSLQRGDEKPTAA